MPIVDFFGLATSPGQGETGSHPDAESHPRTLAGDTRRQKRCVTLAEPVKVLPVSRAVKNAVLCTDNAP